MLVGDRYVQLKSKRIEFTTIISLIFSYLFLNHKMIAQDSYGQEKSGKNSVFTGSQEKSGKVRKIS